MKKKLFLMLALLCAVAQGAWADEWDAVYTQTQTKQSDWTALSAGSTTGRTLGSANATTYYYATGNLSFTNATAGGSGLTILGTVYLYVPEGMTLTCTGANASGQTGAGAGIEVALGNSLYFLGGGTVNATGGNAENGRNGSNGNDANFDYDDYCQPGSGGAGGNGGGGAGAGIGTRGGNGGTGGSGGTARRDENEGTNLGVSGSAGTAGNTASAMGLLYIFQTVTVNAHGGSKGSAGSCGSRGNNAAEDPYNQYAAAGGGGGGAGGFGGSANNIGTGGPGGGGGGGGAAGNSTWRANSTNGFYRVGAGGGGGGKNGDGSSALDGVTSELTNPWAAELKDGLVGDYNDNGWESGNGAASGGSGGDTGAASVAGTANYAAQWPTQGAGTAESPYLINNAADWNGFAINVGNGHTYSDKYVKLNTDISVSAMAGNSETNSFQGHFDGGGKTLTFNVSGWTEDFAAPFRYVGNATFRNLNLTGTISTSAQFASSLIAYVSSVGSTVIIENCVSSMTLSSTLDGNNANGGFIGAIANNSTVTINGCVFRGSFEGSSSDHNAGFVGWVNAGTLLRINDCLFTPNHISTELDGCETWARVSEATLYLTNCYYTQTYGTEQGKLATVLNSAPDNLGDLIQDYGATKAYVNSLLFDGKYYYDPLTDINTSTTINTNERKTIFKDGVLSGFTADVGSNGKGQEGYPNAIDNNTGSVWTGNLIDATYFIEFHSSGAFIPTGYIITTGNYDQFVPGGNPKDWTIQAKKEPSHEWTTLVSVTDQSLSDHLWTPTEFTIDGVTTAYKYFRFQVTETCWPGNGYNAHFVQISEFQFKGITTDDDNFDLVRPLDGAGTAESPYTISNESDWKALVANVNIDHQTYSGKYVRLDADISVAKAVGTSESYSFQGVFDGNGHTITAAINDNSKQGAAPFRYIKNATIKNLNVVGTITSTQRHAAAIVGFANSTGNNVNRIQKCTVSADVNGNEYVGGIVGHAGNSNIEIRGCVYSGLMTGGNNYTGAFIGWGDSGTRNITDCLYILKDGQSTTNFELVKEGGTLTIENCYKSVVVGTQGTYGFLVDAAPAGIGTLLNDYGYLKVYQHGVWYADKWYVDPEMMLRGAGTAEAPFLISSTDEWNRLVTAVNGSYDFRDKYLQLDADISVTTMVGTSEANSFQGTFLGDGIHTLTFTKGTSSSAFDEQNCAPFRYVKNATIRNLKVAGDIYTNKKFAAGLIGRSYGTTTITNCLVGTVIHSTVNGDGTHGGVVAMPSSTLNIEDCAYTGHLLTNNSTNSCGGFVAWHNSATISVTNSLYAPTGSIPSGWSTINDGATFVRGGSPTLTNCYYTEAMGTAQGINVSNTSPGNDITKQITICDITVYAVAPCTVSGVEDTYNLNEGFAYITLVVNDPNHSNNLTLGTDYTATLNGNSVTSFPIRIETAIDYTLVLTGTDSYVDSKTINFSATGVLPTYTFTDGDTYTRTEDHEVISATYTKSLNESRVNKHQAWFVPFDYTITADDAAKFDFYKINMIANAPNAETNATDQIWMFLKKMSANDVLYANMPYVYKPKQAVENYTFTTDYAVLKAKATDARITMMTAEDTYTVFGTYEPTTATTSDPFYYVNISGGVSYGDAVTVGAFRWIMRAESKFGTPNVSYVREIHFFDGEDEATSISEELRVKSEESAEWYTLDGRKLSGKPSRAGVYINKGVKVVIK